VRSFEDPRAVAHRGDVLGIVKGGGSAMREEVRSHRYGRISLREFNGLVREGKWVDRAPCCAVLVPAEGARVLATFDDGSPAVIENRFGDGRVITFAFDIGLIANNITIPKLYRWWSELLSSLGCRKVLDTQNCFVEAGVWEDDSGNQLVILINHDAEREQMAKLPDGTSVTLKPNEARALVLSSPRQRHGRVRNGIPG